MNILGRGTDHKDKTESSVSSRVQIKIGIQVVQESPILSSMADKAMFRAC